MGMKKYVCLDFEKAKQLKKKLEEENKYHWQIDTVELIEE